MSYDINYKLCKEISNKKFCIYKISNKINNKIYIGQTRQKFIYRLRRHVCECNKGNTAYFYFSVRKHGWNNFEFEIIEDYESYEKLNEREKYWIAYYKSNSKEFGYNLTEGGDTHTVSLETRNKIADKKRGVPLSEEHKIKISEGNKGKIVVISEETKLKISATLKGRMPEKPIHETMKGRIPARSGSHLTEKHKKILSVCHTGKSFMTEEGRLKNSIRMTGSNNHVYKDVSTELLIQLLKQNTPFLEMVAKFSVQPPTLISKIKSQLNYNGYYEAVCDLYYKPKLIQCIIDNKDMISIAKDLNLKTKASVYRKLDFLGFKSIKEARKSLIPNR